MNKVGRFGVGAMIFVVLAGVFGACSKDSGDAEAVSDTAGGSVAEYEAPAAKAAGRAGGADTGSMAYGVPTRQQALPNEPGGVSTSSNGGTAADIDLAAPEAGPDVIKTADLELELERDGLQKAVRDSISVAARFGGFVLSTSTEGEGAGSGTVVIRVPAESFEDALTALEGLGNVESETVSGRDVSQEFVDLEARVRNLKAQETVLLRLMNQAQTVTDTIRVQNELSGIQLEIERLTGRIRYLRDQADTSTISLHLFETGAVVDKPKGGTLAKAFERAVDLALGVVSAVIVGTGVLIPLLALALVGYLILRALRPRVSL